MTDRDGLLIAKTEDLFTLCDKYAAPRFSQFLDGGEAAYIEDNFHMPYGYNVRFFGGFPDSERKILGVFPEWTEAEEGLFPISVLKISGGYNRELTHRDYLGTILSLGIDRAKTGDIIIDEDGFAYAAVMEDIAEYIAGNITKIGNQGVKVVILDDVKELSPKRRFANISTVCASLRADAVVGAVTGLARSGASKLVTSERVRVNHRLITDTSKQIKEGDLLSIQGFGRFILESEDGKTRSGRIHISVKKYI